VKRVLFALSFFATSAFAEPPQVLVLDRPNDSLAAVTLPLPTNATLAECGQFDIMAYYCLRVATGHEEPVLSELSSGVLAHGWAAVGDGHRATRPYSNIFRATPAPGECPPVIMIVSGDHTANTAEPLPAGVIEVKITQSVDVFCMFDGLDSQRQ
jgi:hypothetical protein